jgi:hypothetical protein
MAVIRPKDLMIVKVDIEFNYLHYTKLEIDLEHINRGKNFSRETKFSVEEIIFLAQLFIDGEHLELDAQKYYEDESCNYFIMIKKFQDNNYKLIFCICTDREDSLGIMTIFRIKE